MSAIERPPRLYSAYFGDRSEFERMARVLEYTAHAHLAGWEITIERIDARDFKMHPRARPSHVANTQKMDAWYRAVKAAQDGDRLVLIDADTFIAGSLDSVWRKKFDVAYTSKASKLPFNSGVIFLRIGDRSRRFVYTWWRMNEKLLRNEREHIEWRKRYGGINQASFGAVLEKGTTGDARLLALPCVVWNCEDSAWRNFKPGRTRIVHVKSALRRTLFGRASGKDRRKPGVDELVKHWRLLEAEAQKKAAA